MNIEVSGDAQSGSFKFAFKRHVFVTVGVVFITGGIATLTGPWWLPMAEALLGRAGVPIEPDHKWLLGGCLIVAGLSVIAYKHFVMDARLAQREADRKLIAPLTAQVSDVRTYFASLGDDHSYRSSLDTIFENWRTRFRRPESSFQDKATASLYLEFATASDRLHSFARINFFIFPRDCPSDGDYRYCLWPHYNIDREMLSYDKEKAQKYDQFSNELAELLRQAESSFNAFVQHLNKQGHLS